MSQTKGKSLQFEGIVQKRSPAKDIYDSFTLFSSFDGCFQIWRALRFRGGCSLVNGRSWHSFDRRCCRVADLTLSLGQHVTLSLGCYSPAFG